MTDRALLHRAPALSVLVSLAALGCGPGDGPPDDTGSDVGSLDAGDLDAGDLDAGDLDARSEPVSLAIEDAQARLEVLSNPLRIRLLGAGGAVLLESAPSAIELGLATGDASRYHDVTVEAPARVRWQALDLGVRTDSAVEGLLGDGTGATARLTLSHVAPGVLRLRVSTEEEAGRVALTRTRWQSDDGTYHGLGERFSGADARGYVVPMQMSVSSLPRESGTNEHHVPVPFVVSSHGWGLFVESREAGAFDVGLAAPDEVRATFEGSTIDYVFFVAPTPSEVIAAYTRHTGLPILPPRWAHAPMHWRNVWDDRAQLEADARDLVALHIPATSFWIDNPWMTSYTDNLFDEARFEDHVAMLAGLRASGFRPLVWNVPYLDAPDDGVADNPAEALYEVAARDGHLVRNRDGSPYLAPSALGVSGLGQPAAMLDFTREASIAFWAARLTPLVRDLGIRSFKLDYGEDVVPEIFNARPALRFGDGTTERQTHNVYAMQYHTPYRQALDTHSDEGGFLLVRASCWGGQRVADIVWPGDIDSNLTRGDTRNVGGLPAAVSAMLSLAASGFPNFASDTGGFREGPADLETIMRWAEHTAFSPFLQLGGSGAHHNPWLYAPTAQIPDPTGSYRELARAHTELVPYLRMNAIRASRDGTPPVLHPSLAYPLDRAGYGDPDAYLLGEDVFVAVVVEPGATERTLHLPPGRWVHWWTGEAFEGPTALTVPAPVGRPPVFVRVGALLPMLAHDLETLVPAPTPLGLQRIDPSQRRFLRVRALPMGTRTIEVEEGFRIGAVRDTTLTLFVEPTDPHALIDTVRFEVDLAHAVPALEVVTSVEHEGAPIAAVTLAELALGCADVCWARDGATLHVSVPRDGARVIVR